jgi:hypothetical protein
MKFRHLLTIFSLGLMVISSALTACGLIDDNQTDCPEEISVTCVLNLVNNKEQEMDDKLGSEHDLPLRAALEDYLTKIFINSVKDVDMVFYDQRHRGKMIATQHEIMNAEQRVFEVRIPASDYRMAGAANLSVVPTVTLENVENITAPVSLIQKKGEKQPSHPTAVFSARKRLLVRDRESQEYTVTYQMANAAAALVLNRDSCDVKSIRADYGGLADAFKILDSAYTFDQHTLIETEQIDVVPYMGSDRDVSYDEDIWVYDLFWTRWKKVPLMVCGVGFPSPNVSSEVIGTYPKIWTIYLYVTLEDGSVTRNEIYIGQPLRAGHLMIIKGWICGDGSFSASPEHPPYNPSGGPDVPPGPEPPEPEPPADSTVVGVSVQLNWREGLVINPVL